MNRPPIIDPEKQREEMIAYLDGELSSAECFEVEERLANDPAYRGEMRDHEQAWEALDSLPSTSVDEGFAATTMEMVAVSAAKEDGTRRDRWPIRCVRDWGVTAAAVAVACIVGFTIATAAAALLHRSGIVSQTNDQLLGDLPVIENMELYQEVDDIEFLRALAGEGLFVEGEEHE